MLAIILAAGQGKRLANLCYDRPKPTLPIAGHYKVIDFTLSNCLRSQIDDISVLVDYHRSNIATYLERWHLHNAAKHNFHLLAPRRDPYLGTADTVFQHLALLDRWPKEKSVLILAADHVYQMDYRQMLAFHEKSGADVTVAAKTVTGEQRQRFGILTTDTENRIIDFAEKPELPQSNLASMGIYIFNVNVLRDVLRADALHRHSPHDFARSIIPEMVKNSRVFAYHFDGFWQDIGNLEAYYDTNMKFCDPPTPFDLKGTMAATDPDSTLPLPLQHEQAKIINSVVSHGCIVKGHVEHSVLSPGVYIEEYAVVKNSIIMANSTIGYHSVVDCSIVDEDVHIGKYCFVGFGASRLPNESDLTVLGKGATVPPYTAIGRNCRVSPNVGPADFVNRAVPHDRNVSVIDTYPRNVLAADKMMTIQAVMPAPRRS